MRPGIPIHEPPPGSDLYDFQPPRNKRAVALYGSTDLDRAGRRRPPEIADRALISPPGRWASAMIGLAEGGPARPDARSSGKKDLLQHHLGQPSAIGWLGFRRRLETMGLGAIPAAARCHASRPVAQTPSAVKRAALAVSGRA